MSAFVARLRCATAARQPPPEQCAEAGWQDRRESNPQPPVLETGALPIELLSSTSARGRGFAAVPSGPSLQCTAATSAAPFRSLALPLSPAAPRFSPLVIANQLSTIRQSPIRNRQSAIRNR